MKDLFLNMHLIDTHVHIDFYENPIQIADQYEQLGIYTLFVTNLPELFKKYLKIYNGYKFIRLCLGYHPQISSEFPLNRQIFDSMINNTRYIGEVGLDFSKEHTDVIKRQIDDFKYITSPIFNKGRVYTIHSKGTEDVVLDILVKNKVQHAIFHWYSGKLSTLRKIVNQNYYFSINPQMLKTKNGTKIINQIPKNLILFETDGPFTRDKKHIITPGDLNEIYNNFESVIPNFKQIVFNNFKRLLFEKDLYKFQS